MTTKQDRKSVRILHDQTVKAIRRGEKFARSLKSVVAQRNPDTPLAPLLEAVGKGLATLGVEAEKLERIGWPEKGAEKTRGKSRRSTETPTGNAKAAGGNAPKTHGKRNGPETPDQPSH